MDMPPQYTESFVRFLLRNTPLSPTEAEVLTSRLELVCLNENDFFLEAGMPVHKIGYVVSGILRRFIIDHKGDELIQQFIFEDRFFTDLDGFFCQKPSGTYIQAITPCQCQVLSVRQLELLQQNNPKIGPIIAQIGIQHLLERISTDDLLRSGTAAQQYHKFIDRFGCQANRIPLKYIASYLRITQQSLSRIRRQQR